jgi:hypothetical protein
MPGRSAGARVPTSQPERAVALLRPVAALHHAARCADLCFRVEPSERSFYAADISRSLERAAELGRESPRG